MGIYHLIERPKGKTDVLLYTLFLFSTRVAETFQDNRRKRFTVANIFKRENRRFTNKLNKLLLQQLITHSVHDQASNGFGPYFLLHVLADGFYGARAQENFF